MSFLFKDDVLAQLLVDSGLFEKLNKYGQQTSNEAKLIAVKLTNQLMNQAVEKSGVDDAEIYVKDLVDIDAYLNFLWKNNVKDDNGMLIAYHDASGATPPKNPDLYTKYIKGGVDTGFYVIKDALLEKLRELDVAANQVGNEVMKPLVKGLISQANSALGISYESQGKLPSNPYNEGGGANGHGNGNAHGRDHGEYTRVNYSPDGDREGSDPNYQHVSDKREGQDGLGKQVQSLLNNLPFQSDDALSPYDMQSFLGNALQLIVSHQQLNNGRMNVEFTQFNNNMSQNMASWNALINRVAAAGKGASNVQSYQTQVPYNRGNRPNTTLETIFGSNANAKEAAQRLLQMVVLMQQAIASLNRSPQIVGLISKDILNSQFNRARAFAESLTPFARS